MTEDELKRDLTGAIFKIPHTENGYQTASEYLSGDIRKNFVKLRRSLSTILISISTYRH